MSADVMRASGAIPAMIRRSALVIATAATLVLATGCTSARSAAGLPDGSYVEGGYGTPFYAEVVYAAKEGQKPRIYLFGKIADFDAFQTTHEVPENAHKKFIAKGKHRETIVVQDIKGIELKENPTYADKLLAKYIARNGSPAPVAE
jgi:hypothetical protein